MSHGDARRVTGSPQSGREARNNQESDSQSGTPLFADIVAGAPVGERLGRYMLCYELATGGMATVYLGRVEGPAGFGKLVALKRILPHLARDPRFVEMFLDEARLAARIDHPNVCSVFDFGETDGSYFIAMEYLVGETLGRILRRLRDRPEIAADSRYPMVVARIIADAAEGLHAAHELRDDQGQLVGLVHRDVSPQNLFVTYDGAVKVVDFGVARAAGRIHQTKTGTLKGKLAYIAPEQLQKVPIDRRADVWSLGVVLWEALTLRRLFRRDTEMDTLVAVAQQRIDPPSSLRPGIPSKLDDVVIRALERDRDRRWPTARALGRELQQFLVSSGAVVGPAEVSEWMAQLFPDERARRMELVRAAKTYVPPADPTVVTPAPSSESVSMVVGRQPDRARRLRMLLGAALGVALLGGAGAAIVLGRSSSEPRSEAATSGGGPASATPAPAALGDTTTGPSADDERAHGSPSRASSEQSQPTSSEPAPTPAPRGDDGSEQESAGDSSPGESPESRQPSSSSEEPTASSSARDQRPSTKTSRGAAPRRPGAQGSRQPEASRREETATGVVNIVVLNGWADIYVRGRLMGRTPARLTLPVGPTTVELRPFGSGPALRRQVVVSEEEPARIAVELSAR
ncbi:MAG: protein kinase [Myxococcota bacterium]|nr:protein kinase [Myxococcota bacterium]MDW8362505.1 protein kinase [Myxococcales bacterium]